MRMTAFALALSAVLAATVARMSAATCGLPKQAQTSKQAQSRISLRSSGLQSIRAACSRGTTSAAGLSAARA
jgi:hypothetical protein